MIIIYLYDLFTYYDPDLYIIKLYYYYFPKPNI